MTIEAELLELLESVVSVAPAGDTRRDGKVTPGEAVSIRAHVQLKRHMVRNQEGQEVVAQGMALLDDAYPWIDERCRVVLPDGNPVVLVAVETAYGLNEDTGVNGPYQTVLHY